MISVLLRRNFGTTLVAGRAGDGVRDCDAACRASRGLEKAARGGGADQAGSGDEPRKICPEINPK